MSTQIQVDHFTKALYALLDETLLTETKKCTHSFQTSLHSRWLAHSPKPTTVRQWLLGDEEPMRVICR
jgi:hypothetical protein